MPAPPDFQLYLASASPRRKILLEQLGLRPRIVPLDLDEAQAEGETPEHYVQRVALDKARAGWQRLGPSERTRPVLGADTSVVLDGEVLGKPLDRDHGLAMLARLSGRCHEVLSAVAVVGPASEAVRLQRSRVQMRPISAAEREAYWASGEPEGKAGGYAIQGLGAVFIAHLDGSFSGVMGLPLYETAALLREFGIAVLGGGAA
jgi:septum formation protein